MDCASLCMKLDDFTGKLCYEKARRRDKTRSGKASNNSTEYMKWKKIIQT